MENSSQSFLKDLKRLAILAVILIACWYFRMVLAYIIVSFIFALILRPFARLLRKTVIFRHRISDWGAATVSLLLMWAVFALLLSIIIPLTMGRIQALGNIDLASVFASIHTPLEDAIDSISGFMADGDSQSPLIQMIDNALVNVADFDTLNRTFSEAVSIGLETLIFAFSVSFITFFFIKDETLFSRMVTALFPDRNAENVQSALKQTDILLARYLIGLLAESVVIATVLSLALTAVGMKFSDACFIGMTMGIMNIIPYAGPLIGGILAVFVGLVSPIDGLTAGSTILITLGVILVIKGIDDFIIQPTIYSGRVKAHPLEIFLVILLAGTIGGIVGMLVAIPAYTVLRVFAKVFFPEMKIVRLLTDDI